MLPCLETSAPFHLVHGPRHLSLLPRRSSWYSRMVTPATHPRTSRHLDLQVAAAVRLVSKAYRDLNNEAGSLAKGVAEPCVRALHDNNVTSTANTPVEISKQEGYKCTPSRSRARPCPSAASTTSIAMPGGLLEPHNVHVPEVRMRVRRIAFSWEGVSASSLSVFCHDLLRQDAYM